MGPKRDNVWREDGIVEKFPPGGPKVLWRTPVAGGYAGPAVAGGKVYVTDYVTAADVKIPNFDRKEFSKLYPSVSLPPVPHQILFDCAPAWRRVSQPRRMKCLTGRRLGSYFPAWRCSLLAG